jgi:hypothetical protein
MQVVYARCAGLDVHKKTSSACVSMSGGGEGAKRQQTRVFRTFTSDFLAGGLVEEQGVTHVAMEATSVRGVLEENVTVTGMVIPDVNILVHAYDLDSHGHERARRWWETTLQQPRPVRLPWVSSLGFIRIANPPRNIDESTRSTGCDRPCS